VRSPRPECRTTLSNMTISETLTTLSRWEEALGGLESRIQSTLQGSEQEFLEAGSRLQGFLVKGREISDLCSSAVDLTGEDMMGHIAGELQQELDRMAGHLASSSRNTAGSISSMAEMYVAITELNETRRGFKKVISTLRVLAISTRIESARLGSNEFGFNTLADDVEKLARQIEAKYGSIIAKAHDLTGFVEDVLAKTQALSLLQRKTASDVIAETRAGISEIIRINAKSAEVSEEVSLRLGQIVSRIHEVVTSLQFHDITRQQLEHVAEAFADARNKIGEASGNGNGDPSAVREVSGWVGDVSELESSQVLNSKNELFDAVGQLQDNLRDISGTVLSVLRSIQSILRSTDKEEGNLLMVVEQQIAGVVRLLRDSQEREKEMAASMASVSDTVGDMERFVNDIEEIGAEIELIALNARIKAAHTGSHGEALGVLAEAIQKLSGEARGETEMVQGALVSISDGARALKDLSSDDQKAQVSVVEETAENMDSLVRRLNDLDREFMAGIEQMGERVAELEAEIREVTEGMQHHLVVGETVNFIQNGLGTIVSESRDIVPVHEIENREERLAELMSRYTMQSERNIHQTALGEASEVIKESDGSDDELGSNVELF